MVKFINPESSRRIIEAVISQFSSINQNVDFYKISPLLVKIIIKIHIDLTY